MPVVRAGTAAGTAIWAAFGGDVNEVFQRNRFGRPILPVDRVYDLGSQGWCYDPRTRGYQLHAHPDLVRAGWDKAADATIGAIDLIVDDGSFTMEIPGEPGHHLGSTLRHETVATIPVRVGDVQARLGQVATGPFDYEPLRQ